VPPLQTVEAWEAGNFSIRPSARARTHTHTHTRCVAGRDVHQADETSDRSHFSVSSIKRSVAVLLLNARREQQNVCKRVGFGGWLAVRLSNLRSLAITQHPFSD
jgi:hypothetical protein